MLLAYPLLHKHLRLECLDLCQGSQYTNSGWKNGRKGNEEGNEERKGERARGSGKISVSAAVLYKHHHQNLSHLTWAVLCMGKGATIVWDVSWLEGQWGSLDFMACLICVPKICMAKGTRSFIFSTSYHHCVFVPLDDLRLVMLPMTCSESFVYACVCEFLCGNCVHNECTTSTSEYVVQLPKRHSHLRYNRQSRGCHQHLWANSSTRARPELPHPPTQTHTHTHTHTHKHKVKPRETVTQNRLSLRKTQICLIDWVTNSIKHVCDLK